VIGQICRRHFASPSFANMASPVSNEFSDCYFVVDGASFDFVVLAALVVVFADLVSVEARFCLVDF